MVAHAKHLGIDKSDCSTLVVVLGGTMAAGRLLFGKVVQLGFLNYLQMIQLSMVATASITMLLPVFTSFLGLTIAVREMGFTACSHAVLVLMTA